MTLQATKLVTADQLLEMGDMGRCELIDGEIVMMSPAGYDHGNIARRICFHITQFVEDHDLGDVLIAEAGFLLARNPDLVRTPDLSFVSRNRRPKAPWPKYFPGAPDLAIEVNSPTDTKKNIARKVEDWLSHGTISVWVVDPETMTLTVHRKEQAPLRLAVNDELPPEPTLPGFTLAISRIFSRP